MPIPDFIQPKVATLDVDRIYKLKPLILIGSLLIASIVVTNIIGVKVMTLFGLNFTAGVITYGLVFLCTDIIGEIWGKRTGYFFVALGLLCSLLMLVFVELAIASPGASFWIRTPDGFDQAVAYEHTFGMIKNTVIASMIAFLVSQTHDVWAFDFWRRKTKGRWLILRNNASTFTSQLLDTVIFVTIAFLPLLTIQECLSMIAGQLIIKWAIAILDTPFILLAVRLLGEPVEGAHPTYE